ncbi:para-aminobenzoate synthetase / 4-amino-4-deoxychorismate lyase [bacterium JGI 053]|nr:para-aminobenzoate synthetase / 4-amino-4-deoxychorismate lyase [bacterium JGI 053]
MKDPSTAAQPTVRLDSLDSQRGPRSFRFDGLRAVIRADAIEDVLPALRAIEDAVADGLHAAGFVAYEAAPAFDPALATRPADPRIPLLWFALYERRIDADRYEPGADAEAASLAELRPDVAEDDHAAAVERIRELIASGDTYQVNYTFRLRGAFDGSPLALYRRLCDAQQAAFCAYVDFGDGVIVSASPELFFRWGGGELELRPMKGTRPRGRWLEEDRDQALALAASPKDRAENLMIVDLLRNDAGRIAEFGSVRVEHMFEVEPYPTVLQMTSTVRARTPPETRLTDVFRALFPCGSITGAPKVRTSQIIVELEASPRGVYTGAIGFVSPGEALFSVAIRTLVIDRATGEAELGVGSGVTYDSTAADEYRECLSKAAFVHHAPPPALLETFGWAPETGFARLDAHLERLARSAGYFAYPFDADALRRRLDTLAPEMPRKPRRVRVELSPRGEVRIEHSPMRRWEEPVRLALARRHIPSEHPFWYHKTADRARYDAHDPVDAAHDHALLVNERGELAETPIANLVVELEGVLWTPHLDAGLLPGVLRGELLRAGTIRERVVFAADLERATALWVISSLRGWGRAVMAADPVNPPLESAEADCVPS